MKNMVKNKNVMGGGGEMKLWYTLIQVPGRPCLKFYRIWVSQYHKGISYMSNTEKIDAW